MRSCGQVPTPPGDMRVENLHHVGSRIPCPFSHSLPQRRLEGIGGRLLERLGSGVRRGDRPQEQRKRFLVARCVQRIHHRPPYHSEVRFPWARHAQHEASFSASAIYHIYCFSLPHGTPIAELADTLLARGVASTAAWSSQTEVRVAHRYGDLHGLLMQLQAVADVQKVRDGELSAFAWVKENPRLALSVLRRFVARRWGRRRQSGASSGRSEPTGEPLQSEIKRAEEAMAKTRAFLRMYHEIESTFYAPGYLQRDPFIRLELRSFRITSKYFDDEDVLPFLLLHESGVGLLTYATAPKDGIGTGGIIELARGDTPHIQSAYVHQEFFGRTQAKAAAEAATEVHDGTGWARVAWESEISFSDLFDVHLERILEACKTRQGQFGDWRCYSTVQLNHLDCCSSREEWLRNHRQELIGLTNRVPGYASLKESLMVPDDSIAVGYSRYWQISHCISVRWKFGSTPRRPAATDDHWMNVLIEHILLQVWQLRQLDWRVSTHDWKPRSLEQLQTEIAVGLEEYHSPDTIAYGSARETIRRLLAMHGVDDLYQRILDRLNTLAAVIAARDARASSRRSVVTAGAAVLATIVLGLPAIDQSIGLLRTTTRGRVGRAIAPLRDFVVHHPNATWLGYLALLAFSAILFGYSLVTIPRRRRIRTNRHEIGITWPGPSLQVVHERPDYDHGRAQSRDPDQRGAQREQRPRANSE